jgi:glutathione S-transferase
VRTPVEKRDPAAIAAAAAEAGKVWAMVDAKLGAHEFICGDTPTIADVAFGPHAHRWFVLPVERPHLPALRAWYDRLLTRRPYVAHCAQTPA